MPYLKLDNGNVYFAEDIANDGIPLYFVHGSGGGHHHFGYQVRDLNSNISPIALDLPGHGKSDGEAFANIEHYRNWLHQFIIKHNNGPFIIAGHSMGGAIALDYALTYKQDILAIILISTGSRLKVLPDFLNALAKGIVPENLASLLYGRGTDKELLEKGKKELELTDPSILFADFSACNNFDVSDRLHEINIPALILCGEEDKMTPLKYSHYLANNLSNGTMIEIKDAGHMVMIEKPEPVNEAISQFVENQFSI